MKQTTKNNIVVGSGFSKLGAVYELRSNVPAILRWSFDGAVLTLVAMILLFGWVNRYGIASIIGGQSTLYAGMEKNNASSESGSGNASGSDGDPANPTSSPANQPVTAGTNDNDFPTDPQQEDPPVDPNGPPRPPEGEDMPPDPSTPEPPTGESGI